MKLLLMIYWVGFFLCASCLPCNLRYFNNNRRNGFKSTSETTHRYEVVSGWEPGWTKNMLRQIVFQFLCRVNSYIIYLYFYLFEPHSAAQKTFFCIIYIAGRELNNKQKSAEAQCVKTRRTNIEIKSVVFLLLISGGKAIKMLKTLRARCAVCDAESTNILSSSYLCYFLAVSPS